MLLILSLLATALAAPKNIPLSTEDLAATNDGLKALVDKINTDLPTLAVSNHFDPLPHVAYGSANGDVNLGVCTAGAEIGYHLKNLVGLKTLKVSELDITSGEQDDKTELLTFVVKGAINPVSLKVDAVGVIGFDSLT